jgi:tRNA dimethylallyltransferase
LHVRPIIVIVGPTAGGKTELSLALARRLPGGGECIAADSMQVYRGMDIGTAKPTATERAAAPHHLLDVADPGTDGFSVDRWLELAEAAIADVRRRGRWPVVVGGTNLYIQALLKGLDGGPPPDPDLRERLQAEDGATLRRRLEAVDPAAAARIHPNDRKRTIRALEVFEATGHPISSQQSRWLAAGIRPDAVVVGLEHPVDAINRRINGRVRAMIEQGLVEETRALLAHDRLGPQAREALGYKQVIDHLEGRLSREEAVEQIKIRTRRFAKQQRTWLRRFRHLPGAIWLEIDPDAEPQDHVEKALMGVMHHPAATGAAPPSAAAPVRSPFPGRVDRSSGVD